jgi:hypothetical protein
MNNQLIYLSDKEIADGLNNKTSKFSGKYLYHRGCKYEVIQGHMNGITVVKVEGDKNEM